jgi:hypothetical protein
MLVGVGKFIAFMSIFITFIILQLIKEVLIVKQVKRQVEVILTTIFSRVLLTLLGVYSLTYKYQKHSDR